MAGRFPMSTTCSCRVTDPVLAQLSPGRFKAGKVEHYVWTLPNVNHVFLPGHRIMVQIQSSLFPLYDRNPQTYVDNIMYAKPGDYKKATQSVWFGGANASAVVLPAVP